MPSSERAALDVERLEAELDAVEVVPEAAIDARPLRTLFAAVEERRQAMAGVDRAVREARAAGIGWGDIARALGVTRQGARQRYGTDRQKA